jgi:hypothetical protein
LKLRFALDNIVEVGMNNEPFTRGVVVVHSSSISLILNAKSAIDQIVKD